MITYGEQTDPPVGGIDCYEGITLTIGKYCSIASGLKIYSGTHPCIDHPKVVSTFPFKERWNADYPPSKMGGQVTIGNDVWIATDVRILEGITIGDGAIIGAGSIIGSDVPPYTIAIGNPWKVLRKRFTDKQIKKLLEIKWWDFPKEIIERTLWSMKDIDEFLKNY